MRYALINSENDIINIIEAFPEDQAPPGMSLVAVPEDTAVDPNWEYSPETGFTDPRPPEIVTPVD